MSGNFYKVQKQLRTSRDKIEELEWKISELERKLHYEKNKEYNQIIGNLVNESEDWEETARKWKMKYLEIKRRANEISKIGILNFDIYEVLFDERIGNWTVGERLLFLGQEPIDVGSVRKMIGVNKD